VREDSKSRNVNAVPKTQKGCRHTTMPWLHPPMAWLCDDSHSGEAKAARVRFRYRDLRDVIASHDARDECA
jgi:hypothetical protein